MIGIASEEPQKTRSRRDDVLTPEIVAPVLDVRVVAPAAVAGAARLSIA